MKRKKRSIKEPIETGGCYTQSPPWVIAKTKQVAYNKGLNDGMDRGSSMATTAADIKYKELASQEHRDRLQALRDICQAGSSVVGAMAKALLSYDKNL